MIAKARSTYRNDKRYGPQYAVDGKVVPAHPFLFHDNGEQFPWLQVREPNCLNCSFEGKHSFSDALGQLSVRRHGSGEQKLAGSNPSLSSMAVTLTKS